LLCERNRKWHGRLAAARERGGRRGGVAARGARPAPVPVAGGGASKSPINKSPLLHFFGSKAGEPARRTVAASRLGISTGPSPP